MVNYKCYRCGKDFRQKCHMLNHLVRKNPCKSVLKEISNMEILKLNKIKEYNKSKYNILNISSKNEDNILNISSKNENNICEYCNKRLSNYKNKWRHEKTCKVKLEKDNMYELLKSLRNEVEELKNENKKLKGNTSIKGNNNMNNTQIIFR